MKSSNSLKIIIAGICSTLISIGFGRFIYTPILPNMQDDLNLSSTIMGIISSYNYFGYLVGSIISIVWKFNNFKNVIVISSICTVITIYLMGFTKDLKIFIALRFLCGMSSAFAFVFTISLMFNIFKDMKNQTLQLYHFCGIGFGILIGTMIVWVISNSYLFWNHQWISIGFIGFLLCMPIIFYTPKQIFLVTDESDSIQNKFKLDFFTITFGYFFFGVGYIIFGTFISAIAKDFFEISSYQYLSWILVGIFATPSVLIWDWVSKKTSKDFLLFFSCLTVALGVSLLFFNNNLSYFLISCMLYGLGVPGSVALVLVEGKKRFIGNVNISVAIMTTAFSVGQILGPFVSGILIDSEGDYETSILLAIICLLFSSILMISPKRFKNFLL